GLRGATTRAWNLSTATWSAETTARTMKVCRPGGRIVVTSQLPLSPKYQGELRAVHAWKPSMKKSTSETCPCDESSCGDAIQWLRTGSTVLPSSDEVTVNPVLASLWASAEETATTPARRARESAWVRRLIMYLPFGDARVASGRAS